MSQEAGAVTAIDRLNELLEAERAGVDTFSRLFPEARGPEMQALFEAVRDDEAWSCAGQGWVVTTACSPRAFRPPSAASSMR
jgi:hypothetical protein